MGTTVYPIRGACERLDNAAARTYPKPPSREEEDETDAYYFELSKQRSGKFHW